MQAEYLRKIINNKARITAFSRSDVSEEKVWHSELLLSLDFLRIMERIYGRKHYVKIRFAVDVRTKNIVAMDVASRRRLISEACMDGVYDSSKTCFLLRRMM